MKKINLLLSFIILPVLVFCQALWQNGATYQVGDIVQSGNYNFKSLNNFVSWTQPIYDSQNWDLLWNNGDVWQNGIYYNVGDEVTYNQKLFKATNNFSSYNPPVDELAKWEILSAWHDGDLFINNWTYKTGNIVTYNGLLYKALNNFSSNYQTPVNDYNNWDLLWNNGDAWITGIRYSVGDIVQYNGVFYKATQSNISNNNPVVDSYMWIITSLDNDGDGYNDDVDAFPNDPTEWLDTDSDGIGNNADTDDDNDSYADTNDAFPLDPTEWLDTDSDGIGNNADTDDDNDSYVDTDDAFPLDPTEWLDTDSDGIGNNADTDDDNDSYADIDDAFPLDPTEWVDTDSDGIGNNADTDDDNDSYADSDDAFPLDPTEWLDTDSDGIGNNTDTDDDNDSYADIDDAFPLDSTEWIDTDSDGIGNNADTDDDNDSYADTDDAFPLDPTRWAKLKLCVNTNLVGTNNVDIIENDNIIASFISGVNSTLECADHTSLNLIIRITHNSGIVQDLEVTLTDNYKFSTISFEGKPLSKSLYTITKDEEDEIEIKFSNLGSHSNSQIFTIETNSQTTGNVLVIDRSNGGVFKVNSSYYPEFLQYSLKIQGSNSYNFEINTLDGDGKLDWNTVSSVLPGIYKYEITIVNQNSIQKVYNGQVQVK